VIEPRETPYAKTVDGANIAYEVTGNGPVDLLLVPGGGSHLELAWDVEACATFFRRLASFSRLIRYDLGGTGLSDPLSLSEQPSVEDSVKEMVAVLDAVDCERAASLRLSSTGATPDWSERRTIPGDSRARS